MTDLAARADLIRAYHQRTKHHLDRYAAGPGSLDWDAQPDPFRHWVGTRYYPLKRDRPEPTVPWSDLASARPAAPLNLENLTTLLRLSVAITAWKAYADSRWSLRAHPSSGNLHPTETWVIAYWVEGLADGLYHYQPKEHTLEWRAEALEAADTPGLWLAFSSIHWREAWKYGERALRYCQLDMGHVLAAVAHAAALLGWTVNLVPIAHDRLAHCLGLDRAEEYAGVEPEEAECLLAIQVPGQAAPALPPLDWDEWSGTPALLDPHPLYQWPIIEEAAAASRASEPPPSPPGARPDSAPAAARPAPGGGGEASPAASDVILRRRSAQAFDGRSVMPTQVFAAILRRLLPGDPIMAMLRPGAARVHPLLLIHRVAGIAPGLYALPRSEAGLTGLAAAARREFTWRPAHPELPLYELAVARAERTARTLSCHQDIASHGAFTLLFAAEFDAPIAADPAAWRHLHWEAGMLGHAATLEAEAQGWRGTGIGCFFDDADHELLGFGDSRFQVIYHYAIGMPVDDPRLTTLPAYA